MKKFKQLVMAFLVGVVSFGFTACDDNNNEEKFELPEVGQATVNVSSSDKEMQKVAKVYVNQVVYPTYLQAVAADVRNITALLEFTWMGSAASNETKSVLSNASYVFSSLRYNGLAANGTMCYGQFLLSPSVTTGYNLWQGTVRQIFVGGCSNICAEVADQKLGQAYCTATGSGSAEDSRDYIESPYSHRSFIDYQDNIYSIKNSLYGTRDVNAASPAEHSLLNLLKAMNYSGLNDLTAALNNAIQALETAKNSGKSFVEAPGAQHVKDCIDAVSALDEELNKAGDWVNKQEAL
ncbi:MAG: imelysin family protein [Prevotella sp.]|nr:imelysin family protein [Prevotella sp.]